MILQAHGIRVAVLAGWSGKVFARSPRTATLHAGDFQLPLSEDGEFGPESTSEMPPVASFLALTEYQPGGGLRPGNGLFAPHGIRQFAIRKVPPWRKSIIRPPLLPRGSGSTDQLVADTVVYSCRSADIFPQVLPIGHSDGGTRLLC